MTRKQLLSIISLWFFTIGSFYFGFSWLTFYTTCNTMKQDISRVTASQDNLLISFGVFGDKKKLNKLKSSLNVRETLIKNNIEHFKEHCRSMRYKRQLVTILKQYEIYLHMKQAVLQEKQDHDWHQSLFPVELAFKK